MASASRPPPPPVGNLEAALSELPVFPLPNVVLFPGALMPLHIFEPRYRTMIRNVLETHRAFAMTQQLGEALDAQGQPPMASIATAALIVDHAELPDGRFNILIRGEARVALDELPFVPPYRRAKATVLLDEGESASVDDVTALLAVATSFATEVRQQNPDFDFEVPPSLPRERTADFIAHYLVIDAGIRQKLLELRDPAKRVQLTLETLVSQRLQSRRSTSGPPS